MVYLVSHPELPLPPSEFIVVDRLFTTQVMPTDQEMDFIVLVAGNARKQVVEDNCVRVVEVWQQYNELPNQNLFVQPRFIGNHTVYPNEIQLPRLRINCHGFPCHRASARCRGETKTSPESISKRNL